VSATTRRGAPASSPGSPAPDAKVEQPSVGGLAGVVGQPLPRVPLRHHSGSQVVLRGKLRVLVIYAFPGCVCSPEDGYRSPSQDVAQHRAFAGRREEFDALDCRVVGVSSQGVELQRDANVEHLLLCDPRLEFARQLGLPTFDADGSSWYRRCLLIAVNGRVAHAVYPVSSPGQSAAHVIEWLRANRDELDGG